MISPSQPRSLSRVLAVPLPQSLEELWVRHDVGCAFIMCGYPIALRQFDVVPIAAAIPVAPWAQRRAVYRTDLVVKADSRYEQLSDSFGGRIGCSRVTCTLSSSIQTARALLFGGRSNTRRSVPALASRELQQFARERPFLIGSESLPSKARRRSIPSFRVAH
jgi:hypothetical protein